MLIWNHINALRCEVWTKRRRRATVQYYIHYALNRFKKWQVLHIYITYTTAIYLFPLISYTIGIIFFMICYT